MPVSTEHDEDLTDWRLEQLEKGQADLLGAVRAQGEALKFNRELEVAEHTAIRKDFVDGLAKLASEFGGRLWAVGSAVIIAIIAAALGQGLIG